MKRVLFSSLLLLAACSKGDSKSGSTTPPSELGATTEAAEPAEPAEPAQPAEPAEPAQPAEPSEATQPTEPAEPAEPATDTKPKTGAATNLQVLPKSWSSKKVKGYMKQLTKGLGVKCSHCHESGNNASDKLPAKLAARKMLKMTRSLDKKFFGGKGRLSCITCHKGKVQP